MKILLTAFDPFGGEAVNPAELAVAAVEFPGHTLKKLTIPTEYARCETVLAAALDDMVRALEIAPAECVEFVNSR